MKSSERDGLLFPPTASVMLGGLCTDIKSAFPAQQASEVGQVLIAETKRVKQPSVSLFHVQQR